MSSCCVELSEHNMELLKFICVTYLIISSKGDQCKNNQHCSDCDRSTGRCLIDCDTGYFDQMCTSVCSKNCRNRSCQLSVSGIGACTEGCVSGYQGPGCNVRCGSPGGTCVACPGGCDGGYCQLGSSCVSGCVGSHYGTDCNTCSSRCKSCNRMTGLCTECHPGYFGPSCAYSCDHCLGSCEHGCADGCLPGFYSIYCNEKCSENCGPGPNVSTSKPLQAPDAGLPVCHIASGDCIHGCKEGWHGQQCSFPCSPNCANKICKSTGDCVDGCVPGHFSRDCKPCPVNCLHNSCHPDNGKCTDGCTRGFYGGLCQHTCEVCLDGVCHQKTGTCTMGCHLTGPRCDSTCTFNCSIAECLRVEHCNHGNSDSSIVDLKIGLSAAFSLFVVIILLALSPVYCKHLRTFKQHKIQGIIPHEAPSHEDQLPPEYCEIIDGYVDIVCELPVIRGDESVTGAAPVIPVLADCFVADCDSAVNDIAAVEQSAVDDNTYTHLVRPVVVERPETVVNYVSQIEE